MIETVKCASYIVVMTYQDYPAAPEERIELVVLLTSDGLIASDRIYGFKRDATNNYSGRTRFIPLALEDSTGDFTHFIPIGADGADAYDPYKLAELRFQPRPLKTGQEIERIDSDGGEYIYSVKSIEPWNSTRD